MLRRDGPRTLRPLQALSKAASSSSLTSGTGFIFNVGGDRVAIGFVVISPSSTSHEQNRNSPAVSGLDGPRLVGGR